MTTDHLNFTVFFDETGSITNDKPEIFGGSLFIIEDSEIGQCREFLKELYPNGVHCKNLSKEKRLKIADKIGTFLKDKNCCTVTGIQINTNLMKDYEKTTERKYSCRPTAEALSLLKRYWNYTSIPRFSVPGIFNLIQGQNSKKIKVKIIMENIIRNKALDRWDLYSESLNRSLETYKSDYFTNDVKIKDFVKNIIIGMPESKTKKEESMFSFPDLFAYSIRRIVTHKEYELYNKLKHIFDRSGGGYCSEPELFKAHPNGIFIQYLNAEELDRLSELSDKGWCEELKKNIKK